MTSSSDHSDIAIQVSGLTFRYRDRPEPAIRDVAFSLRRGEMLLLSGTSGCGKTTLARCINGLIPRSYRGEMQGSIILQGKDSGAMNLGQISQIVGTVMQDPERQIVASHVMQEVAFGLENLALPREEVYGRVMDTLDYLGIRHLAERETFSLSGGEKQKVALAGALAMQPSILLLDEPLASLDPASAVEALALFRRLADEGITLLVIEHRVENVLSVHPDRAIYMEDSRIQYAGSAEGLIDAVDYRQVKLPAPAVMRRARGEPLPDRPAPAARRPGESLVAFDKVSFAYDDGPLVLRDVSLQIHSGEIIAVLGPNGAGKTTLMKHTIGLLKPTQGRVLVGGQDTRRLTVAQAAHTLGYVFQSPTHMLFAPTVREELAFGPRNLSKTETEISGNVLHAVQALNLSGLEDYPPLALSFGQQKRVSIASVLAMGTRILIMDEPTAGQDYFNYMAFMDSILAMADFETILFITHDLDLAVVYANRVILVGNEGVAADGAPFDVLRDTALLEACRIVPTSLLEINLEYYPSTKRFFRAEELAQKTKEVM
ncbi:MAG: ABC transporter ATP-binding protein [Anaerolineales bacterium]